MLEFEIQELEMFECKMQELEILEFQIWELEIFELEAMQCTIILATPPVKGRGRETIMMPSTYTG